MEARPNRVFQRAFGAYTDWLLRRSFHALHARGLEHLAADPWPPTLIAVNHSAWWDPLVGFWLSRRVPMPGLFYPMDVRHLRHYGFFRWIGAWGMDRDGGALAATRYVLATLKPGRTLFVTPQGRQMPNDARPLRFERGAATWSTRVPGCRLVPAALRFEFLEEQRPEIFVSIGAPVRVEGGARAVNAALEASVTALLDAVRADVVREDFGSFRTLFRGRGSLGAPARPR